jgi:hypothetical protein
MLRTGVGQSTGKIRRWRYFRVHTAHQDFGVYLGLGVQAVATTLSEKNSTVPAGTLIGGCRKATHPAARPAKQVGPVDTFGQNGHPHFHDL